MAKVISPLLSFSASGKIGKSMVFFSHLGRNVVRQLVIPKNTKTEEQGSQRLLIGSMGAATSVVQKTGAYYTSAKTSIPAGQTWVSDFVKKMVAKYESGSAGVSNIVTDFDALSSKTNFEGAAADLGLTDIIVPYAKTGSTLIPAGALLMMLGQYGYDRHAKDSSIFTEAVFSKTLATWTGTDVSSFKALLG